MDFDGIEDDWERARRLIRLDSIIHIPEIVQPSKNELQVSDWDQYLEIQA